MNEQQVDVFRACQLESALKEWTERYRAAVDTQPFINWEGELLGELRDIVIEHFDERAE